MNFKKYALLSFFITFSSMFACYKPVEIISFSIKKKLSTGQTLQVELPLELEESLDEMKHSFDSAIGKINRNETYCVEESGKIKDGRLWKLFFTKDENTKQIDCTLEFPTKK